MRLPFLILLFFSAMAFLSCSSNKTVFITNKLKKTITIRVDSNFRQENSNGFKAAIDGQTIDEKLKIGFGSGKWSRQDKADLENLLAHSRFVDPDNAALSSKISVRYIRLGVEELWVILK